MSTVAERQAASLKAEGSSAPFAVTVEFEIAAGARERFLALVKENAGASVREEPGCMRFDVLTPRDAGGSDRVLLYELYDSRAAFDAHLASAHFLAFDSATRDLVTRKTIVEFDVAESAKR